MGNAAPHSNGQGLNLFGYRRASRQAAGGARRRHGGRTESGVLRGALPPGDRKVGKLVRLSLGPDAQTRDSRLGSRNYGKGRLRKIARLLRPTAGMKCKFCAAFALTMG